MRSKNAILKTSILCIALLVGMAGSLHAQVINDNNVVDGLSLPDNQEIDHNLVAAIRVTATTPSEKVKFLVVGSVPGLTSKQADSKSLILDIPRTDATIFVYAIAWHKGEFTQFARTIIQVKGGQNSTTADNKLPALPVFPKPLAITVILSKDDKQNEAVLDWTKSANMQSWLEKGHKLIVYWTDNPSHQISIRNRNLSKYLDQLGSPAFIVQDATTGILLQARQAPTSLEGLVNYLTELLP